MSRDEFVRRAAVLFELPSSATAETSLSDRWDSLVLLGVIALLDEAWEIRVPAAELEAAPTLGALSDLVERHGAVWK